MLGVVALTVIAVSVFPFTAQARVATGSPFTTPIENFLGLGTTQGGCVFPFPTPPAQEPAGCVTTGAPPDPVGAVGPNNYVELDNGGIAIYDKSGNLLSTPAFLNTIWAGYPKTDGNNCAAGPNDTPAGDFGDPIVRYDQLANRWLVSQFDLTNFVTKGTGPSFECVAVSQTGDPTGGWNKYDFKYSAALNDYPKFGVWPDGYYVTYNEFSASAYLDAKVCALDRTAMLAGQPASQVCAGTNTTTFSLLPANVEGPVPPPAGSPEYLATLGTNSIKLYKFSVNWAAKTGSLTGPTTLATSAFSQACNGGVCIPQPSPGNQLDSLGDRLMDRLVYRNFGTHESLLLTHSVTAGAVASGVRWYEVRNLGGTPSIYQQGTYAPDSSSRWMGSIAMDQAGNIGLGYSLSSSTIKPSIAYTGRLASDPLGQMPQGEGTIGTGNGVESGTFGDGSPANRWGDYSSMTVDPSDDCTFWYVNQLYASNGAFSWDTRVGSFKFPSCAVNDFSMSPAPSAVSVDQSSSTQATINTTLTKGTAEAVTLVAQNLPKGVTAAFNPTTPTAGTSSTVTFNASSTASLGTYTVGIIASAASATHYTTLTLTVTDPTTANFSIAANPPGVSATQGASGQTSIDTTVTAGSPQTIAFQTAGLPTGATAAYAPTSVVAGQSSTLTLSADGATPPGTYTVTVTGTESPSGAQHSTDVSFTVNLARTMTITKAGTGTGSVSSEPAGIDCGATCAATFADGTQVTLTATPDASSTFTGWSGACTGTGGCTVNMTQAQAVTATFKILNETLKVSKTGHGTVTSSPSGVNCGLTCSHKFAYGTVVTLTAHPATGSVFVSWSGDCAGTTKTCQLSMTAAHAATAHFVATKLLTVLKAGTGSGMVTSSPAGISCGSTCKHAFAVGTMVTLTPTAKSGSTFKNWSGACTGTGGCVVTMSAAKSVTATFAPAAAPSRLGTELEQIARFVAVF